MAKIAIKIALFPPCFLLGALYGLIAIVNAITAYIAAKLEGGFYWLRQKMEV